MPSDRPDPPESEERKPEKSTIPLSDFERPPEHIGPYRILEQIGEGGMGVVYLAEQEHPVRRKVALKIIKLGMDTKEVIGRFEAERQALAMMSHANIARVFDAGTTEQGRPYFVMEHVPGVPITDYCDRQRLKNRERLELFIQVCQAVHHAHQKGIIHRDLKPSNVLIAIQDGKAVPKVIDFGVAKATSQRLTERTVFTEQGQLIGTPEYMSPEQAEMSGQSVDTTTDVYSLGVMLYELLAGVLPFDAQTLRAAGFEGIQRIIREEEPPTPSTKVSKLGDTGTQVAKRRQTDVAALRRQLHGELDWVTMRAMEKDRSQRYQSASELAADLGRYLRNEPVVARAHSAAYQFQKMVARHTVPFVFAGILLLVVISSGVWMSVLYGRAVRAEHEAVREAETATQTSEFLEGLFEVSDPSEALGNTITAREILDKGAEKIEDELADQPEVQATLMSTMGNVYRSLGLYDSAKPLLESALEKRRRVLGKEHLDVAASLHNLAGALWLKGDYDGAARFSREALAMRRKLLGEEHPHVAMSLNNLANVLGDKGDYEGAEPLYREALAMYRKLLGDEHPDVAMSLNNLALVRLRKGDYDEAESLYREALAMRRKLLGEEHPAVAQSLNNLANVLNDKGDYDGAEPLYREALAMHRKFLGDEHPHVAMNVNNVGNVLWRKGDYHEAELLIREALAMWRKLLGEEHPHVAMSLNNLANVLADKGDYDEAEPLYREALAMRRKLLGEEHPDVAMSLSNLASVLDEGAEPLILEALAMWRKLLGEEHPDVARSLYNLACRKALQGQREEALDYLHQAAKSGYSNADWMMKDTDLASLRGDPEFEAIVADAKKRAQKE